MDRVPRVGRAKDTDATSSKLRLVLFITLIIAIAMLLAGTSVGRRILASSLEVSGALAGGLTLTAAALVLAAGLLLGIFALVSRRKSASVPVRRAFRSQAAQASREGNPLNHVRGRGPFVAALESKLKGHAEEGRQLAVHRIDLDAFRQVNLGFGSDGGDALLEEVSRRLGQLAGEPDNLARFGDDEFAIIQPETGGAKHAEIFAGRIQKALEEPIMVGQSELLATASIGIAVAPEHGSDARRLLTSADLALHLAQQSGRGAVRAYAAEMEQRLERRRAVEQALHQALQGGGFDLRYQPEYDLLSRRLLGFEVLVKLNDPRLGAVEEYEFGPVAEEIGLLPAIGERAIRDACRTAGKWPQHLRLGFNLLPGHLRTGNIARILGDALKANHLSPSRVDLEVCEQAACIEGQQACDELQRLAGMGFRLVVDSYGSGHASPHDLCRHPFSAIKIDAGLVRRLGTGQGTEQLLGAIIKLGQALGREVIADGADSVEQVHFLMLNGCRKIVGPVFGPAVAADKVAALIAKDSKNAAAQEAAERQSSAA